MHSGGYGVYYIDIKWILSQTKIPNEIKYLSKCDSFVMGKSISDYSCKCNYSFPFWVIETQQMCRWIGCGDCDCKSIKCIACEYGINLKTWNINEQFLCNICVSKYSYSSNMYFYIPYNEKDIIKKWGGRWEPQLKLWYIERGSLFEEAISHKYKQFTINFL